MPSIADGLSTLYQDLLGGSYDCVDRIVLNAYFRMGHDPGGFRVWWRALTGSDETLENAYLMRMAGRFSRRIRGYAKAHDIPVIDCSAGQRKHELAEVSTTVRETVDAVAALKKDEVSLGELAAKLGLDKSVTSRRLRQATGLGYLVNRETRRG